MRIFLIMLSGLLFIGCDSSNNSTKKGDSLEQQAYCFGVFNGLQTFNVGFNQGGNNEYFKRYKKEFFDVYTPIMDKIEQCQHSNKDTSINMAAECAKKLNDKQYRLFRENTSGFIDSVEAYQQRNETKLGSLRLMCSITQ
jgi:hypothetical protein